MKIWDNIFGTLQFFPDNVYRVEGKKSMAKVKEYALTISVIGIALSPMELRSFPINLGQVVQVKINVGNDRSRGDVLIHVYQGSDDTEVETTYGLN